MSENSCVCEGDDIDLLQSMIQTIHDEIGTLSANECPQRATISHILLNITYTDGRVVHSETTSNNTPHQKTLPTQEEVVVLP